MISAAEIQVILLTYKKYGWNLRRVLLSDALRNNLSEETESLFGAEKICTAEIDAVWFSRVSGIEREAWELRHLSRTPFAFIEVFDADDDEEIQEQTRAEIEMQMKEKIFRPAVIKEV